MGQKTHPIGFRLGIVQPWHARWFAQGGAQYAALAAEDIKIRQLIKDRYKDGGISHIEIERDTKELGITIRTARPGVVIGRTGKRIEELSNELNKLTGRKVQINTFEVRTPELDATQVAQNIAYQLENRMAFRRAVRTSIQRTMMAGAKGVKIILSGRLGGAEIARTEKQLQGSVPLHTLNAWVDYALAEAMTTYGVIGIKVWIYRGNLDPRKVDFTGSTEESAMQGAAERPAGARERGSGEGRGEGRGRDQRGSGDQRSRGGGGGGGRPQSGGAPAPGGRSDAPAA